jgi:hypothetical protein
MTEYSPFWELELRNVDLFMRWFMRVSAFQLAILNAVIIDLQPTVHQPQGHEFSLPATELVTDMSAQMLHNAVNLSHRVTKLRRDHATEDFKSKMVDSLLQQLLKTTPYDQESKLLFGGAYRKSRKRATKIENEKRATDSSRGNRGNRGGSRGRGGGHAVHSVAPTLTLTQLRFKHHAGEAQKASLQSTTATAVSREGRLRLHPTSEES